jgi:hypothetical protein
MRGRHVGTFLRGGMRGFYARYRGEPTVLRLGDRLFAT